MAEPRPAKPAISIVQVEGRGVGPPRGGLSACAICSGA